MTDVVFPDNEVVLSTQQSAVREVDKPIADIINDFPLPENDPMRVEMIDELLTQAAAKYPPAEAEAPME
eukprot:6655979-Lingulodinium_polyedra.AAC.1